MIHPHLLGRPVSEAPGKGAPCFSSTRQGRLPHRAKRGGGGGVCGDGVQASGSGGGARGGGVREDCGRAGGSRTQGVDRSDFPEYPEWEQPAGVPAGNGFTKVVKRLCAGPAPLTIPFNGPRTSAIVNRNRPCQFRHRQRVDDAMRAPAFQDQGNTVCH